jgi:hypothetical protein
MVARLLSRCVLAAGLLALVLTVPAWADIRFRGSVAAPVHGVDRATTPTLRNPMGARALALADFDSDGRLDIAAAYEPGDRFAPKIAPSIRVMLGKGDGTFDLPVVLPMPSGPGGDPSEVYAVVAGKFDADAFPDIVTALPDRSTLLFFKGLGTGQFAEPVTTTLGAPTLYLRAVDLDGDTLLDLVGWKDATVMVARNAGNGTFTDVQSSTSPAAVAQVEIADLNGDGKPDIVGTNPTLGFTQFVIFMNSGANTFPASPTRVVSAGGKTVTGLVIAEVTNDSHLDLIGFGLFGPSAAGCSMGGIVVAGNGNGTFATPVALDCLNFGYAGANASAAPPTDLDGDGRLDLVVPGYWDPQRGDNLVQVMRRTAAPRGFVVDTYVPLGSQGFGDTPDTQAPTAVVVGDVNGDGRPDLVVASYTTNVSLGPGGVSVLLGAAGGGFHAVRRHATGGGATQADAQATAVADFTGDGKPDLVALVPGPRPSVLKGRGDGGFDTAALGPVLPGAVGSVYDARGVDMDGDQKQDAVLRTDSGGWQVLFGDGNGGLGTLVSGSLPFQRGLALGDFNGDGRRDIATVAGGYTPGGNPTNGLVTVVLGGANRRFGAPQATSLGGRLTPALAAGDVNGDGRDDVILADVGQGTPAVDSIRVLPGNANGSFSPAVETVGFGCANAALESATLADLDNDGRLDVVGVCGLSLLAARGKGDGTFVVPAMSIPVAFAVTAVAVGDLDLDGRPDAVVGTDRSGLWVLAGQGDGTFASPRALGVGHVNIRGLTLADINADGKPEIVASVFSVGVPQVGDRIAVLVNDSTPFSIQPTAAGNLGHVTLRLTGQDIVSGSTVRLVRLGQAERVPTAASFANGVLTVTVDLTGAEVGTWNVELTPPGGGLPVTFTDGLQVEAARISGLYASIAGPFRVRTFREFDYYVWWTNRGNVDIPSALIDVNVEQGSDGSLTLLSAEAVGPDSVATIVRDGGVSASSTSRVLRIRTGVIAPGLPVVGAKFRMRGTADATFYLEVNGQELPAFTPPFERRSEPAVTQAEVLSQTATSVDLRLRLSDDPAAPVDYGLRWSLADGYQPPRLTEEATAAGGRITTTTTVYLTADELAAVGLTPPQAGRLTAALVGPGSYSQIVQSWTSTAFDFSSGRMTQTWSIRSKNILQEMRRRLEECLRDFDVPFDANTFEALDNVKAINEFSDALLNVPRNGISQQVLANQAAALLSAKASEAMTQEVGASLAASLLASSNPAMPQLVLRSLKNFPSLVGGDSAVIDFITSTFQVPGSTGGAYEQRVNERQQLQQLLIQKLLDLCFRCSESSIYKDTTQGPNGSCNCPPKTGAPLVTNLCQPAPGGGGQGGGAGSGGSSSRTPHELSGSFDPNAKYGPGGVGAARYLVPGAPVVYTITFENLATATAPAAEVEVLDTLDATRLDPATFSLGLITFGGDRVVVPPAGAQSYTTTLDLRPAKPFLLRIEAALDRRTNVARWKFTTLDPATNDVPVDPQIGFLPPNTSPPQGEGAVTFFAAPRAGLASGDTLSNGATIVFDANPPIVTPIWTNAVDLTAPEATVTALGATTPTRDFTVAWAGSDAHAGVATYDVYVAEGNGAFTLWLDDTTAASATFFGDPGKLYRFFAQAVDRVGNVQPLPAAAQAQTTVTAPFSSTDADGDGLADAWETAFGLDPTTGLGDQGGQGDADGDAVTNAQEAVAGTHPRGFTRWFLAEGATGGFFDTSIALANPTAAPASVLLRFLKADGTVVSWPLTLAPDSRTTVDPELLSGMGNAEFATSIESDARIVADRLMHWRGGSHLERSVSMPAITWYLAEGATHSGFDLFYLLQNPGSAPSEVRVRYLLPSGAPLVKTYTVAPYSRFNIWVDFEEFPAGSGTLPLANTDVAAVVDVLNGQPIIVERAMYLSKPGETFASGHESAGVTAPATSWFLAEGATGSYFDLFILVANPSPTAAQARVRYLLASGQVVTRDYTVGANSRFNIWVDHEDPALAEAAVSTTLQVLNGVPVIVERAMWWPGDASQWFEAHNSPGSTATGTKWALAEGQVGGPLAQETYVLIANTSSTPGTARVTLLFEDGTTAVRDFPLTANSRFNVAVAAEFPEAANRRFGTVVQSIGDNPAQIVVERALYGTEGGTVWTLGSNSLATRLQ